MIKIKNNQTVQKGALMTNEFINEAIALARQSAEKSQGGPFGAVVVKDNQVIGRGSNQVTTHNDPTAHAEIGAIRDACQTLKTFSLHDCTLYSSSEPCSMCLSAIYWARIEQVFFANTYKQAGDIGFDDQFIFKQLNLAHKDKQLAISRIKDKSVLKNALEVLNYGKRTLPG